MVLAKRVLGVRKLLYQNLGLVSDVNPLKETVSGFPCPELTTRRFVCLCLWFAKVDRQGIIIELTICRVHYQTIGLHLTPNVMCVPYKIQGNAFLSGKEKKHVGGYTTRSGVVLVEKSPLATYQSEHISVLATGVGGGIQVKQVLPHLEGEVTDLMEIHGWHDGDTLAEPLVRASRFTVGKFGSSPR